MVRKSRSVSVRFHPKTLQKIQGAADSLGASRSAVIRLAIDQHLEKAGDLIASIAGKKSRQMKHSDKNLEKRNRRR